MFKVSNKETTRRCDVLIVNFELCSGVSVVNFEHVIAGCVINYLWNSCLELLDFSDYHVLS